MGRKRLPPDDPREWISRAKSNLAIDDSPWTREKLLAFAWERVKHKDWDEHDDLLKKP
ncbi:MAG: hypothetical protein ACJ8FY_13385 [Gemmataceae bacterium]